MMTNELLEEKWRTQARMAREAGGNIKRLLDSNEQLVARMVQEYGLKLVYVDQRAKRDSRAKFERAMRKVADAEPGEYDRL